MCIHIWQASREIWVQERLPFTNALGGITNKPPWAFCWRCYVATLLWWVVPVALLVLIWNKYPIPLPGQSRFAVEVNTNVILPDLSVLNNLPRHPSPEKDRPPSLLDLFNEDYPTAMKVQNNLTLRGVDVPLKQVVYLDFPAKSKFVGLYVPMGTKPYGETAVICKAFAGQVEYALKTVEKNIYMKGGIGEQNAREIPDLTFTNVVVIYHEDILNIGEKADILATFKDKEMDVQFRGPDYISFRDNAWRQTHSGH